MGNNKKLITLVFALSGVIVVGVIGYMYFLDVGFVDALYMTAITISTVGYGEVTEMNVQSKLFSIVIIISGLSVVGYGFTSFVALFLKVNLRMLGGERKWIILLKT